MKTGKLIARIEETDPSNQIQITDLINELTECIFMKNRITELVMRPDYDYIGSEEYHKHHATLSHYKLKVVSLISTL
jgi:hypothetical protein